MIGGIGLFNIRGKDGEISRFGLTDWQMRQAVQLGVMSEPVRWSVDNQGRQVGATTLFAAIVYNQCLEHPLRNGLIVSHNFRAMQNVKQTVRLFENNPLPNLHFCSAPTAMDTLRSGRLWHYVLIDQWRYYNAPDRIIQDAFLAMPDNKGILFIVNS